VDIALYARVLWRFKFLVLGGIVLGVALAVLSMAKVTFAHGKPALKYRTPPTYASFATVLINSGKGFPWGSAVGASGTGALDSLSIFYSHLASTDPVKQRLHLLPGESAGMLVSPVLDASQGACCITLPMLSIEGYAQTASLAIDVARRGTQAFIGYISERQQAARIPASQRVSLQVLNPAIGAVVISKRKKTVPILVFGLVLAAAVGLAFLLENLRPSVRLVDNRLRYEEPAKRRPAEALVEDSPGAESA